LALFFVLCRYVVEPREAAKAARVVAVDPSGVAVKPKEVTRPSLVSLWDRFPKFVLGFFVLSIITTMLAQPWALGPALVSRSAEGPFLLMTEGLSDWWNLVGFVGLGAETDVSAMMKKVKGGSVILLYFIGQLFKCDSLPPSLSLSLSLSLSPCSLATPRSDCCALTGMSMCLCMCAFWVPHCSVGLTLAVSWWMFKDLEID
jgi:hypothetical protein